MIFVVNCNVNYETKKACLQPFTFPEPSVESGVFIPLCVPLLPPIQCYAFRPEELPFSAFYSSGLLVKNFVSMSFFSILTLFQEYFLSGIDFWVDVFSTQKKVVYCVLASTISDEKSAVIPIIFFLCVICFFSLGA